MPPADFDQSQPLPSNQIWPAAMEWTDLCPVWWSTEGKTNSNLKDKSIMNVCLHASCWWDVNTSCVMWLLVQFIKVQIRRDLALDVSAAPADTSLSALPPQAATPILPLARFTTKNSLPPQSPLAPQALVEISNKTIIFPTTPSGETSGMEVTDQRTGCALLFKFEL